MNYRSVLSFTPEGAITCRIETTHAAADPGSNVYGNLRIARGHLECWIERAIDDLRDARRLWLTMAERKLPSDEPRIEQTPVPEASTTSLPAAGAHRFTETHDRQVDDMIREADVAAGVDLEIPENLRRVPRRS